MITQAIGTREKHITVILLKKGPSSKPILVSYTHTPLTILVRKRYTNLQQIL